jgi:murein DD-endopeptidase MepM/ murein hydrolase activator NlpD
VIATRQRHRRRRRVRRGPDRRRVRRLGALVVVLIITAVVVAAARSGDDGSGTTAGIAPVNTRELAPNAPPEVQLLSTVGEGRLRDRLLLYIPVSQRRITAIVYHATGAAGAIALDPVGTQRNAGFISRLGERLFGGGGSDGPDYFIDDGGSGPDTGSVDVGAPAGTDVYAPVDGVVVGVRPYILNGRRDLGSVIQIRPDKAPAVVLTLTAIDREGSGVDVGSRVTASTTRLGSIVDLSKVLEQTVASYTSDAGNHVALQLSRAPGTSPLL